MEFLLQFDYSNSLNQTPSPLNGTCSWINQNHDFQRWQTPWSGPNHSEAPRAFCIYGEPGVGKTVMSKYILTHLRETLKIDNSQPHIIAYFFCDNKDPKRRTSFHLLHSFLFQILLLDKKLLRYISEDALEIQRSRKSSTNLEDLSGLWDTLLTIIQRSRSIRFWFIIDGVDELDPKSRVNVSNMLSRISEKDTVGRLKILVTDRRTPKHQFSNQANLELGADESQNDIRTYIRQALTEFSKGVPIEPKLKTAIEDEIILMANGNILHASLALANFTQGVTDWTPRNIRRRFNKLQELPATLEAYYAGLLRQIPSDFQRKARKAFTWVLGSISRAPLTLKEIHYAVSVNEDQTAWSDLVEDLGYNFESSFQELCGYLLKIDADGFVIFSHQTVKELLESTSSSARETDEQILRNYRITPKDIDVEIVQTCLTVLQLKDFDRYNVEESLMSEKVVHYHCYKDNQHPVLEQVERFPLLSYAIRYWSHFDYPSNEAHVVKSLQKFFQSFQGNYFRLVAGPRTSLSRKIIPGSPGLLQLNLPPLHHCTQRGDFPKTILALMASESDVNELDSDGMSPLHWACARGNKDAVVALLSNHQLDPNAGLPGQDRPIHVALLWHSKRSGNTGSVEVPFLLLKDQRTDVNITGVAFTDSLPCLKLCSYFHSSPLKHLFTFVCVMAVDTLSSRTSCLTTRISI